MRIGVAVGLSKGAPQMKLFKADQAIQSEEDRARDARLANIATRYRPTRPDHSGAEHHQSTESAR